LALTASIPRRKSAGIIVDIAAPVMTITKPAATCPR